MSEATISQREFTHDEAQSNSELYFANRPLVDAIAKAGDDATDYLSHGATFVDGLRELAPTKSQFAALMKCIRALLKSGWEGSASRDIERANECTERLNDQVDRGKGLHVGDKFGNYSMAGVAAICLGIVESDSKIRDGFAQMGKK